MPAATSGPVITGVGLVSALGDTPEALMAGVIAGDVVSTSRRPIEGFDVKRYIARKGLASLSRVSQLACAAASNCAPALRGVPAGEVGVVLGTGWAALDSIVDFERRAHLDGSRFVDPLLFTETVANVPAGHVSIFNGWSAVNVTVASGTASGLESLRMASELLDDERATAVLAGGADAMPVHAAELVVANASRGALGEGACWLVLEPSATAAARGASCLAQLAGVATRHVDEADPTEALGDLAKTLLDRAGLHGAELAVVHDARGRDAARKIAERWVGPTGGAVFEPASALGETWGAAGSFALAVAATALAGGRASTALVLVAAATGHLGGAVLLAKEPV